MRDELSAASAAWLALAVLRITTCHVLQLPPINRPQFLFNCTGMYWTYEHPTMHQKAQPHLCPLEILETPLSFWGEKVVPRTSLGSSRSALTARGDRLPKPFGQRHRVVGKGLDRRGARGWSFDRPCPWLVWGILINTPSQTGNRAETSIGSSRTSGAFRPLVRPEPGARRSCEPDWCAHQTAGLASTNM